MPKSKKGDLLYVTASQFTYGEGGVIGVSCAAVNRRVMKFVLNDYGSIPPSEYSGGGLSNDSGGKENDLSEYS
jgi:hypothetical protein